MALQAVERFTPTSGGTVTISSNILVGRIVAILNCSAELAQLNINFPSGVEGQELMIVSTKMIDEVDVTSGASVTVPHPPGSIDENGSCVYIYTDDNSINSWLKKCIN